MSKQPIEDACRAVAKWLNEEPNGESPREAMADLCNSTRALVDEVKRQQALMLEKTKLTTFVIQQRDQLQAEVKKLKIALNPQLWTGEVSALWHTSIPDTGLAFYELRKWAALNKGAE